MDKRSPKSPVLYERYKSSCAWSLIGFCDFGQGQSNRKLISRRRGLKSLVLDHREINNRLDLLSNIDEECLRSDVGVKKNPLMIDSAEADVIEARDGDMSSVLQVKKKIANTRRENVVPDIQPVGNLPTKRETKASMAFQKYGCKGISAIRHKQLSYQNSLNRSSQKLNSETVTETSCNQAHPKNERVYSCRSVSHEKDSQLSEVNLQVKMNEAAEAFINQKFIKGKYVSKKRANQESKHFLDALEILNSNKELFIKLLQDPNSLLVKHIQDLRHSQAKKQEAKSSTEAKLSENCRTAVKENVDPQTSDKILVLNAGSMTTQNYTEDTANWSSPQSIYSLRNRVQSTKPAYFSFEHMKRKLRHAIGLSRNQKSRMSTDCRLHTSPPDLQGLGEVSKGKDREMSDSNSCSKFNLVTGEMEKSSSVKRREKLGKVKESEPGNKEPVALNAGSDHGNSKSSVAGHLKQSESNMYLESRTHFSKAFRIGNEDFSRKQVPVNSERTASLPESDFSSAFSLGRNREQEFFEAQMRFSPYSYYQMVNQKKQKLQREKKNVQTTDQLQTFDKRPNIYENLCPDIRRHENVCSISSSSSSRGFAKTVETYTSDEPNSIHNNGAKQSSCPANTYEDNGNYLLRSKMDSPVENCTVLSSEDVYSSSPLSSNRLEDSDGMNDKVEHPSPVSVLEQFFVEDITSPLSTISKFVESKQDNYEEQYSTALVTSPEDQKINSSDVINEHKSLSQYIKAVLQASGIKWEELPMKFHSSDQILEPFLLQKLELLLRNQFSDDCKLLFDYMNEILLEVYQCNFSSSPWVSFLRPKIQPVQAATNVANEVMKCVDWYLLSQHPSPTLDQLVQKDLAKSITWMDIQKDTEDAVIELVESILEELTLEMSIDLHI